MAHYPPRPRPRGKPKSIAKLAMDKPDMTPDRAKDISHVIHKRLREQSKARTIS